MSKADLIKRLQTGTPPNAKSPDEKSFTSASSKFKSPQDWLAGREISAAAAKSQGVDVEAKSLEYPPKKGTVDEIPIAVDFVVDHGKDIDEAFVGQKKNVKLTDGEPAVDKTYESFEEMTGLTRSYVNWIWEFAPLTDVPTKDDPGKKETVKAKTVKDYVEAYKRKNADADPPNIAGRWVMMQQFPLAEGWDNKLKAYTNEPKGLIP